MEMKSGEIIAVFLVSVLIVGVSYSVLRKRDTFMVYDEKGNAISMRNA